MPAAGSDGYASEGARVLTQAGDGYTLPFTGGDILWLVAIGVIFIVSAVAILYMSRDIEPFDEKG